MNTIRNSEELCGAAIIRLKKSRVRLKSGKGSRGLYREEIPGNRMSKIPFVQFNK